MIYLTRAFSMGIDHSNRERIMYSDRPGFLYEGSATVTYPNIVLSHPEVMRDRKTGLPFNFPYDSGDRFLLDCPNTFELRRLRNSDEDGHVGRHDTGPVQPGDAARSSADNLIVAGASYQMGIPLEANPGAGFYFVRNLGIDETGLPVPTIRTIVAGHEINTSRRNR